MNSAKKSIKASKRVAQVARHETERVQKILANAGLGSRRHIEELIKDNRVKINGKFAQLGDKASLEDKLYVNGKLVKNLPSSQKDRKVIIYNKPVGEIVSRQDPERRKSVFDSLPSFANGRWIAVGRLDINSSGLMIFTNDGELANRLMHPKYSIDREYAVRVQGEVTENQIKRLVSGVTLDDGKARFEEVIESGGRKTNRWFHVAIMEGRKREVRRLWDAVGLTVSRLKRVRYGPIILDSSVKVGNWRELDKNERKKILESVGMKMDKPWGTVLKASIKKSSKSARSNRGTRSPSNRKQSK